MPDEIFSEDALQREIHEALRVQHPEWVESNGAAPMLEFYKGRFAALLQLIADNRRRRSTGPKKYPPYPGLYTSFP